MNTNTCWEILNSCKSLNELSDKMSQFSEDTGRWFLYKNEVIHHIYKDTDIIEESKIYNLPETNIEESDELDFEKEIKKEEDYTDI